MLRQLIHVFKGVHTDNHTSQDTETRHRLHISLQHTEGDVYVFINDYYVVTAFLAL